MAHHPKHSTYQLAVIANDFHIPFHDERALLLFKLFLRRERPDWLILNGDFQDFWEISNYDVTPRTGKEFRQEIEIGKRIVRSFWRSLPRARITWIDLTVEFLRGAAEQHAPQRRDRLFVPDVIKIKSQTPWI